MKNETTTAKAAGKRPDYTAFHVIDRDGGKARWIEIGAAFAHESGQGMTLLLDVLPVSFTGRIVLRKPAQR